MSLPLRRMNRSGIKTLFEGKHPDFKFFLHEQAEGTLGRFCAGGVGIEIDDHILAEAPEQLGLNSVNAVPELAITL